MQSISPETQFWEAPVFEINRQHILVTGGSSGFGRHFAGFLASNGARITLAARRAEALASAVAEINAAGSNAQSVVLYVTCADKIDDAMKQAEAKFGPIHAVVNNAGQAAMAKTGLLVRWKIDMSEGPRFRYSFPKTNN